MNKNQSTRARRGTPARVLERSDVRWPLWRKKVDATLLDGGETPIPVWVASEWNIPSRFHECQSKSDPRSRIEIDFNGATWEGWVVRKSGRAKEYRLFVHASMTVALKHTFLMSYMRALEEKLERASEDELEKRVPFWEFLDLEMDPRDAKLRATAHYVQQPIFPLLFRQLIESPAVREIDDATQRSSARTRTYAKRWRPRENSMIALTGEEANVIYMLLDSTNKLFYVGEAGRLKRRLQQGHSQIPQWDYFRYIKLPKALEAHRVAIERLLITSFAEILPNRAGVEALPLAGFTLANNKIDVPA